MAKKICKSRNVKIISTGKYLPPNIIHSSELDKNLGRPNNWTLKHTGIESRRYITNETASQMAAIAINQALDNANMPLQEIECIVSASGAMEQAIPATAALVQKALNAEHLGIPCFDVNSTCLSFVTALDLISGLIELGQYNNAIIVSSEIASNALNWDDPYSCTLFGDGAVAVIIGKTTNPGTSKILCSKMHTYSNGSSYAEVIGGGNKYHPREYSEETKTNFLFKMDGEKIYKLASKYLPGIVNDTLKAVNMSMNEIDMVIPHQASLLAMKLAQKKLGITDEKFMNIIKNHGNTIAASIPMALHEAITQKKIERGNIIMMIGTSAGLSIGAMIVEY